jgi:RES domain-containing protein
VARKIPTPCGRGGLTASQHVGDAWLQRGAHLALAVPSVLVPQEKNYVVNVAHAQFAGVRVANAEPFSFDEQWDRSRRFHSH